MAESFISDRIIFPNDELQRAFILDTKKSLNYSWKNLAILVGVNERTVRGWVRDGIKMPYDTAILLSKKTKINLPENCIRRSWADHLKSISSQGGVSNFKKYGVIGGDQNYRKFKWQKWWGKIERDGLVNEKFSFLNKKEIKIPRKNVELAEFVGIMIGDGGVAKYHATITLDAKTDFQYSKFVTRLIYRLFGFHPKIYKKKNCNAVDVVMHRKAFVDFALTIGLKIGNKLKQGLDIPEWVLENEEFSKACVRGLIDTDGSVFLHRYKVKGKMYVYPKISFTSRSEGLIRSVQIFLKKMGFCARISRNGCDIRLESQKDVINYFKVIRSHNHKHLRKYLEWKGGLRRMVRQRIANPSRS